MIAARLYQKGDIRIEEIPMPSFREDEILLRVKAASICGTDVRMVNNGYKGITPETPRILGHELSGVIEQVGSRVIGYEPGQRVAVAPNMGCGICADCVAGNTHLCRTYEALGINLDGGFAEYVTIPAKAVTQGNITLLPDNVSFSESAINEALSCVFNGFERCDIRPGDDVLIIGAGPIGIMHGMLARVAGAGRVYISDLSTQRLDICKYTDPNFITIEGDAESFIQKETQGVGVQVCIVACPSPAAQAMALRVCCNNGRINFFGGLPTDKQPAQLDTNLIHYKQLRVSGTTRSSLTQFRKTIRFISTGILNVKPLITQVLPITDFEKGLACAASGKGLKNVIQF